MLLYIGAAVADGHRWRRQAEETAKKDESLEQELCKDKDAGEWFRLVSGDGDNCRDVIQCTASVCTYSSYPQANLVYIAYAFSSSRQL